MLRSNTHSIRPWSTLATSRTCSSWWQPLRPMVQPMFHLILYLTSPMWLKEVCGRLFLKLCYSQDKWYQLFSTDSLISLYKPVTLVRQNLPFINPGKERNGYTILLPAPRHLIAFHTPGEGVQEDLLPNPPTAVWGQAGWPVVPWISLLEDGLDICLFPPPPVTSTFTHYTTTLPPWHDTHTL